MILKASAVVTMDGPVIVDGAVVVEGKRIVDVGEGRSSSEDGQVIDLSGHALLPGLINAHCHLDYTRLRWAISPPKSFAAWVQHLNALKRTMDSSDFINAISHGFRELQRWGTTTVCNIESFPELMPSLPASPIRTWWFYEMIDIRHRLTSDDVVNGALSFFGRDGASLGNFGLSPHAPYTASQQLYRLANECADELKMPLTTHVAESREELEMFRDARGALYDFLKRLDRPMNDCGHATPFGLLWSSGAIDARWILVHMNELTDDDFELLATAPVIGAPHVVHCPGSHAYFRHSPFPLRRLQDLGINICVGTDSLASGDSLSLLAELRRLWRSEPWLSAEDLLRMITTNPARALDRELHLGRVAPGALADLIAVPITDKHAGVLEQIVAFKESIPWMMIDGKVCA